MARQPNIVLINCDDLGYGDLGCYGSEVHDTPRINQLAAQGTRLLSFYMGSPVCTPSRGAMLTGSYPARIGFDDFDGLHVLFPGSACGLNPSEHTIASVLKGAGYATEIVGKWHCGDQPEFLPTNHGFDRWFGLPYSNDMGIQHSPSLIEEHGDQLIAAGYTLPPVIPYPPLPLMRDDQIVETQPDQTMLTRRYVERSVDFIRENADQPFFLYFAHMHVHLPLYVEDTFHEGSRNGPYGAAVHAIDWATGVLMDELEAQGLHNDTIVVFTSDNGALCRPGEGSNAPLRGKKGRTSDGGIRVPGIVRWPGVIPAGAVCDELLTAMDLLPTLASWAGTAVPADTVIDGRDIAGVLTGDAASPHGTFAYYNGTVLEAVRDARYKLRVVHRSGRDRTIIAELFDLRADIGETTDIAAEHPEEVERLQTAADAFRTELGDSVLGVKGSACRPSGRVEGVCPRALLGDDHPMVIAEYDLSDRG
ncbi:MAG: sulfatase [Acidimicrobiales bacterium]|nr:sulfatase [Acidimicrobiales bacterium]